MICGQYTESLPQDFYLTWIIKDCDCANLEFNPLPEISTEWKLSYDFTSKDEHATFSLDLDVRRTKETLPENLHVKISVILQDGNGALLQKSVRKLKCFEINSIRLAILHMTSADQDFEYPGGFVSSQCNFQFSVQNNSPNICHPVPENQNLLDLSSDLKNAFSEGTYSDVQILVEKDIIQAHKSILSARSSAFEKMFETLSPETTSVTISDTDPNSYRNFLKYLYTGVIEDSKPEALLPLYTLAHRYNVQSLQRECRQTLASGMTMHNASDVLKYSSKYGDEELAEKAKSFLDKNCL